MKRLRVLEVNEHSFHRKIYDAGMNIVLTVNIIKKRNARIMLYTRYYVISEEGGFYRV